MKKLIASLVIILAATSAAYAGKDYSKNHLASLCELTDNSFCEGYLLGALDAQSGNSKICVCEGLCGSSALDTQKMAEKFATWARAEQKETSMQEAAKAFVQEAFSCKRADKNNFVKTNQTAEKPAETKQESK